MKAIKFYKYQGTGNDFIMIDNRKAVFPDNIAIVQRLCARRMGIGSDGLILIQDHPDADFEMVYFNSDGSKSLCGNGSRCAMMFAKQLGIIEDKATFLAIDGLHEAYIKDDLAGIRMHDVSDIENIGDDFFLDTGSPHYVRYVDDVDAVDVVKMGSSIRNSEPYAARGGTNVNFVDLAEAQVKVRTFERGVEDETLSCGTGVTAVALTATLKGLSSPVHIQTRGGNLTIKFKKETSTFTNIFLIGPAIRVFDGTLSI